MSYFLSETYDKPKLVETKLVKKIIAEQIYQITWEEKIFYIFLDFIKKNYKILLVIFIIIIGLYWRYYETKKKKKINMINVESESESEE